MADPSPQDGTSPAVAGVPSYPNSYPTTNPVDILRNVLTKTLTEVTGVTDSGLVFNSLQWQSNLQYGDLLLAAPKLRIKGGKPQDLVKAWAEKFPKLDLVAEPEVEGIYFRFRFEPSKIAQTVLPMIFQQGDKYGSNPAYGMKDPKDPNSGKKFVIVEFSSPNIAKEFHAGHLRSTIIGAFIANLYEFMGYLVSRVNYLGDWGRQYGMLALAWKKYGDEEQFKKDPIRHLFDLYVKISAEFKPEDEAYKEASKRGEDTAALENQGILGEVKNYFKRMEEGDEEILKLWRMMRELSIEKYKTTYARLNIYYDDYGGESQIKPETMERAEKILKEKGIIEQDKGANIINFEKQGAKKLATAVVRNRNGTTNYLLRDVGNLMERWDKYQADKVIYVVMSEQDIHLARAFKTVELVGTPYDEAAKRAEHINYGKIAGMSTRKGTVRFLDDILEEVGSFMHEVMKKNEAKYKQVEEPEKVADILGISAVMVQDMTGKRINGYPFDIARMTSFEGDTGPYLQYAHARLCSIARKSGFSLESLHGANLSLLTESHAVEVIRLMAQWPDVVINTLTTQEPATVLTYLFKLTHRVSSSYDVLKVIGAPEGEETGKARAALYEAARQVLSNGLRVLGLTPVERM